MKLYVSAFCIDANTPKYFDQHYDCSGKFIPQNEKEPVSCQCYCHKQLLSKKEKRERKKIYKPKEWDEKVKTAIF